ncbi:MAG: DNA mismatch repair endonuclease MutL [Clostridiales bacterium]|nr:DNA mismatch repair endonuclease MutL [Clostridiales bacterium]
MKRTISVLDQNTIDKIAAGEVVERPASVVKELVENAIDAGASAVTVEIKEGGTTFIRITDNGSGIEKSQVPLAFLRHATSKIRDVDDLLRISSLGFRGEALSSIAAVSQVELISKPHDQLIGVRYLIEGVMEKGLEEIGAPDGTTFLIRNLFFNTPARAKFLKTPATEAGYISSFIEQLALSHPHISFKYMQNGQTKLHTSGNDNLKEVIYQVYGREITKELIEIDYSDPSGDFQIRGFIGKPTVSRGNRNFENYYVNGRYVKSRILMKAIEDAYHTFMMQHKYPFTSLYITIKGEDVDINVHPTKMEVRFSKQEYVYRQVYQAVLEGLQRKELIPEVTLDSPKRADREKESKAEKKVIHAPEPFEARRRQLEQEAKTAVRTLESNHTDTYSGGKSGMPVRETPSYQAKEAVVKEISKPQAEPSSAKSSLLTDSYALEAPVQIKSQESPLSEKSSVHAQAVPEVNETPVTVSDSPSAKQSVQNQKLPEVQESTQMELFDGKLLSQEAKKHHKIIGQVFDTYWLVQMEDKLYIIDQHAAHEKVLYERIVREMKERQVTSQLLSPPLIISLNLQEQEKMKRYIDVFHSMGFEMESFGGRDYSIRAVPQNLFGLTREEFFIEILDHLEDDPSSKTLEVLSDRMATMACKAAVKGNQQMSATEAAALIDELLELENPYNCPHGRPTIISMTKYELEKKFKRIV